MISICIPIYNTDCSRLLHELNIQIQSIDVDFEVIVVDDGSTSLKHQNATNCKKYGFKFIENTKNLGRVASRMKLANESKHSWLLFIDADMIPKTKDYISNYYNATVKQLHDIIVGGHLYDKRAAKGSLRLRYGKSREEASALIRNKNPYNNIFFGNILIKKNIFFSVFNNYTNPSYGEDIFLSSTLKTKKSKVIHIENQTYHLGVDKNSEFLSKTKCAVETMVQLYKGHKLDLMHIRLVSYYTFLKRYKLSNFVFICLYLLSPILKTILTRFGGPIIFIDFLKLYQFLKEIKK